VNRIVLANDGRSAWLETLPELRISFKHEGEAAAFAHHAAQHGYQVVADAPVATATPDVGPHFFPA
jgi:hypothetical protein